jgi:phosphoenolpyruvate carboxykinase (ATP)
VPGGGAMSGTGQMAVVPSLGQDARWPSRAELRALTERMSSARPTRYGSVNVRTRVTERSTAATVVVADGPHPASRTISREAADRFARLQDQYLASHPSVVVDGHLGHAGRSRSSARLVVELANANVAAMQRELYVDASDLPPGAALAPAITVIDTPNLAVPGVPGGRLVAVWPEEGITRIAGTDYFDDAKKAAVRLWGARVWRAGGLLLHAACMVVESEPGPRAMLLLGRSGAGKSTLTFNRPPGASLAQDDFVALHPGGEVVAAEAGCIEKASLVDPVRQPAIHAAATRQDAYLENVAQIGADPRFGGRPGGPGRVVFGMQAVEHWPGQLPPAGFLLILHPWYGVMPAVARLSVEQAAACLLLRELGGPAGHPGAAGSASTVELAGQADRLRALLHSGDIQAFLVNTGRVGGPDGDDRAKPVRVEHARAVLAAIAAGSIDWELDPDFGWLTAAAVPGVDDGELLQPRRLYERQRRPGDYRRQVELAHAAHAAYLASFPDLDAAVASSLGRGGRWP